MKRRRPLGRIEDLNERYERFASLPWEKTLAGPQRVWFAVYDKMDERRLRARLHPDGGEFALATARAGHRFVLHDLTDTFADWMAAQDYRESYFESPEDLAMALPAFHEHLADSLRSALTATGVDGETVVAICGVASLFGVAFLSKLIEAVEASIRGRLLVFFPGGYDSGNNTYSLLDARAGWNYLAIPITSHKGEELP
jgi:hypothetical protein